MSPTEQSHLRDRVVVVTGAGSGFGRLIVEGCAARGARVVVSDIDEAAVEVAVSDLRAGGASALGVCTDVRDLDQVRSMVQAAVDEFGAVDVMVNNAGIMPLAFMADHATASDAWDRCIDINFKGVLHGISAVYDQMIDQGRGHVVNISSIYGNAGTAGSGVYSATKAAVRVLSDSLRFETQGRIKVTVVRPTGVLGTGLAGTVVNPAASAGIVGPNMDRYMDSVIAQLSDTLSGPAVDVDSTGYFAIQPEDVAREVIHAIDQPWGVVISDVTIRATGEMFVV